MTESAIFRNDLPALRSKQFMHLLQIGVRVLILINIKLGNLEDDDCLKSIAVKRSIQILATMVVPDVLSTPKVLIKVYLKLIRMKGLPFSRKTMTPNFKKILPFPWTSPWPYKKGLLRENIRTLGRPPLPNDPRVPRHHTKFKKII
jgi:hypothetical protein